MNLLKKLWGGLQLDGNLGKSCILAGNQDGSWISLFMSLCLRPQLETVLRDSAGEPTWQPSKAQRLIEQPCVYAGGLHKPSALHELKIALTCLVSAGARRLLVANMVACYFMLDKACYACKPDNGAMNGSLLMKACASNQKASQAGEISAKDAPTTTASSTIECTAPEIGLRPPARMLTTVRMVAPAPATPPNNPEMALPRPYRMQVSQ